MPEVTAVPTIENVAIVSADVSAEKTDSPIDLQIARLTPKQKALIIQFKAFSPMFVSQKVLTEPFKAFAIQAGLYETTSNQVEVDKLQTSIAAVKATLLAHGFDETTETVKGAVKGLTTELGKAQLAVKDNLTDLASYFGVELGKIKGTHTLNGDLATYRPTLGELKTTDYVFAQSSKKAIVVHSSTVAEANLTALKIKADSQLWLAFEFNGELTVDRTRHQDNDGKMLTTVKSIPETWMKVHPVVFEGESLSGLAGKVAKALALPYNGNGWQSIGMLADKFEKVGRVVKEA